MTFLAVVEGISAQTGSNNGHQTLTISGKFFDETTASPQVKIGDADCEVVSLSDTELVVKTPMKPAEDLKFYPGKLDISFDSNKLKVSALYLMINA